MYRFNTEEVIYMRFEVLMVARTLMVILRVVTPCVVTHWYRRFGGTYCLHFQS